MVNDATSNMHLTPQIAMTNKHIITYIALPQRKDASLDTSFAGLPSSIQKALEGIDLNALTSGAFSAPDYQESIQATLPDLRQHWHQLIIIGNGFDLECGLASSFSSFIHARNAQFDGAPQEGSPDTPSYTKTIWDVILSSKKDSNWCDVEGAIATWIAPENGRIASISSKFTKTLHKLSNDTRSYDNSKMEDSVALFLTERYPNHGPWNQSSLLQVTQDDLATFESDFGNYLANEVEKSKSYKNNVGNLMSEIVLDHRPSEEEYDIEESILSFNYTKAVQRFHSREHDAEYVNIHGKLGEDIIFGIDGTDRMDNPFVLPFTKTYRLMALDLPDTGRLVRTPTPGTPSSTGTKMIKFYGHSLGEADYSYFQAIFDSVKLYEGTTRLVFYFRPHQLSDGRMQDGNEARSEMMKKAIRLLTNYGRTLDNKDHGKNLIHKLLVEGRLSVCLLKDTVREG